MREFGWTWRELMATPSDVIDEIAAMMTEHAWRWWPAPAAG